MSFNNYFHRKPLVILKFVVINDSLHFLETSSSCTQHVFLPVNVLTGTLINFWGVG